MSRLSLPGLVLALGCSPAIAHETLPADWCPVGTHPVTISEFRFTPDELMAYQAAHAEALAGNGSSCGDPKTCGIVDQWFWAEDMAAGYCGGAGLRGTLPEEAILFVESPESFNHKHHHDLYRFDEGPLIGQCVVCRASRVTGTTPAPEDR